MAHQEHPRLPTPRTRPLPRTHQQRIPPLHGHTQRLPHPPETQNRSPTPARRSRPRRVQTPQNQNALRRHAPQTRHRTSPHRRPRLLIVDEPTAGLDPAERVRFRTLLANIATDRIVILSTHIVEDIAATSNDLAVLQKGRLLFRGSPTELTNHAKDSVWEVLMPPGQAANPTWRVAASITEPAGTRLRILGNKPTPEATALKPNLEDGYIRLLAEHSPIP